jgi:hypothetical protein
VLPAERSLFTRERNDGLYTTFTSLAGKMFDELVINAIVAAPITAAAFYGIQLQGSFGLFYCVYYATLCVGIGKTCELSAPLPTKQHVNSVCYGERCLLQLRSRSMCAG